MKILILIMTISTSGVMYIGGDPKETVIVSNVEESSLKLYDCNRNSSVWTKCSGELYEINLSCKTVTSVKIPEVMFK